MAFGGILLLNLILTFILALIVPGVLCIIAAMILGIIDLIRNKSGKPRKKWIRITAIILGTTGVLILIPFFILRILFPA